VQFQPNDIVTYQQRWRIFFLGFGARRRKYASCAFWASESGACFLRFLPPTLKPPRVLLYDDLIASLQSLLPTPEPATILHLPPF
jgi:hypothetical protein